MTYAEQLDEWFQNEKKNGLVDFKVTLSPDAKDATVESVCKEILEAIHAPSAPLIDEDDIRL
jgi:hypothetical protein